MILEFSYLNENFRVSLINPNQDPFIEINDNSGPITRYQLGDIRIRLGLQRIDVEYMPQLVDNLGNVRATEPLQAFAATTQENWDYFYLPSRNGENTERMVINGLLIHLRGLMCFDPITGEFMPPVYVEPEPVEENDSAI